MSEYSPCPSCRRHVKDAQCPFCGASATRRDSIALGRVSRAMVFGATLAAAACGGSQKKATNNTDGQKALEENEEREDRRNYQNHPCYEPKDEDVAAAQKKVDEAKTDEERAAAQQELQRVSTPVCAPYGAPPARRRIV